MFVMKQEQHPVLYYYHDLDLQQVYKNTEGPNWSYTRAFSFLFWLEYACCLKLVSTHTVPEEKPVKLFFAIDDAKYIFSQTLRLLQNN